MISTVQTFQVYSWFPCSTFVIPKGAVRSTVETAGLPYVERTVPFGMTNVAYSEYGDCSENCVSPLSTNFTQINMSHPEFFERVQRTVSNLPRDIFNTDKHESSRILKTVESPFFRDIRRVLGGMF